MGLLLPVHARLLGHDVEESVRGATSRKSRLCTYLHDLEDSLPYRAKDVTVVAAVRQKAGMYSPEDSERLLFRVGRTRTEKLIEGVLCRLTLVCAMPGHRSKSFSEAWTISEND